MLVSKPVATNIKRAVLNGQDWLSLNLAACRKRNDCTNGNVSSYWNGFRHQGNSREASSICSLFNIIISVAQNNFPKGLLFLVAPTSPLRSSRSSFWEEVLPNTSRELVSVIRQCFSCTFEITEITGVSRQTLNFPEVLGETNYVQSQKGMFLETGETEKKT